MGFAKVRSGLLFLVCVVPLALSPTSTAALGFKCSATANCTALVGYRSPNATTLAIVQSLFGVAQLSSIIGANNLPELTSANTTVPQGQVVNIPFSCSCSNGTGTSELIPVYTVLPGDTLSHIAVDLFTNLVTFPDIQAVAANNITNPDQIKVGQKLKIPLPCSCDPVDGEKVVHYGHVVVSGSSVEGIAQQFNVSADALRTLNNITSDKDLKADVVIDVPLKACSSSIKNDSLDSSLLVPNLGSGNTTYVLTANNCVKCSCSSANNFTLDCQPSQSNVSVCPSMQCQGNGLYIGNSTSSSCCNYAGYSSNQTAGYSNFTIFTSSDTCPALRNAAAKVDSGAFSWNILVALILATLSLHHLQ